MSIFWAYFLASNMFVLGYVIRHELTRVKIDKMGKTLVRERLMLNEILKRIDEKPEEFTQDEINQYQFDDYLLKVRTKTFDKATCILRNNIL